MDNDLDFFLTSILGGGVGGSLIAFAAQYHLRGLYLKYMQVKDHVKTMVRLKELQDEIVGLRMQIVALQAEMGYQMEEDDDV